MLSAFLGSVLLSFKLPLLASVWECISGDKILKAKVLQNMLLGATSLLGSSGFLQLSIVYVW